MNMKRSLLVVSLSLLVMSGLSCPEDCVDGTPSLAVVRIDYEILSTTSATEGTVRVTGVIQNTGTGTYDSGAGQQSLQLYRGLDFQQQPVAQTDFEDLAPGATLTVTYDVAWDTSAEFPQSFVLYISLDPDLFIDGNEANDECPTSDNLLSRSGEEVNALPGWGS